MKLFIFLLTLAGAAPVGAQYQTDPTHLFPASSNTSPAKKTPPQNKVISTQDRPKAIPLHRKDRFYSINQTKAMPVTSVSKKTKPPTVWKNVKKPGYSSLYQDQK